MKLLDRKAPRTPDPEPEPTADVPISTPPPSAIATGVALELDGERCRVLALEQGRVTRWLSVQGSSPAEALDLAIGRAKLSASQPVRIGWSSPGLQLYRAQRPPRPPQEYPQAVRELAEQILPGQGYQYCGQVLPPEQGQQTVVVMGLESQLLDPIWDVIGLRDRWVLVPTCMAPHPDGLHVAVRWSCSSVYVVHGGVPVAYTDLPHLGLRELHNKVGDLSQLQAAMGSQDPVGATVQGFIRDLQGQVHSWVSSWASNQEIGAGIRACWLHGEGMGIPPIHRELSAWLRTGDQLSLGVLEDREVLPDQRPAAWAPARLAAAPALDPLACLQSPLVLQRRQQRAKRREVSRSVLGVAAAVLVGLAAVATPVLDAWHQRSTAQQHLQQLQQQFAPLRQDYLTWQVVTQGGQLERQVLARQPQLAALYNMVNSTLPSGGILQNLSVQDPRGGAMLVSVQVSVLSSNPLPEISSWMQALRQQGAQSLQASVLSQSNTGGTYTLMFQYSPPEKA